MHKFGIPAVLFLCGMLWAQIANAQEYKYLDAVYDARSMQLGGSDISYPSVGASLSICPDIFYPWPIYLRTGVNALLSVKREGADTPAGYRFEIPLELSYLWDPGPFFSIGPYAGIYGAANLLVAPENPGRFNIWLCGVMAGLCIYPSFFHIYAGYYRDLVPFISGGQGLDGFRFGIGMCI